MTAVATWPADLPQTPLADGFTFEEATSVIRSEVDVGPAKVRRRSTATVGTFSMTLKLTAAQRGTLRDFFRHDLEEGARSFTWTHPLDAGECECRFTGPPSWTWASGYWFAVCGIEVLP